MNSVCNLLNKTRQNRYNYLRIICEPELPDQSRSFIPSNQSIHSFAVNFMKFNAFRYSASVLFSLLLVVSFQLNSLAQPKTLGYTDAVYAGLTANEFMKNWLILGPVHVVESKTKPDEASQKAFFDKDDLTSVVVNPKKALSNIKIGAAEYSWKSVRSEEGIVDLIKLFGQIDYSVAYALAEIRMDAPAKILLGVGSDDGVKIFLNGVLVHKNWIGRATTPDEDIVLIDLKKGSNQILVKVQNMEYGWSFAIRKLGNENLSKLLAESAERGNLDNVKLLAENGADINLKGSSGLTAWQSAAVKGRESVMNYLKEKGAKTDLPMPPFEDLVSNIFKSAQTGITSGVSVLVSKNGEIIYEKGFGYADIGNKVPVTPDTKFRIGSITKQFTASAILKLQEEGKLSVTDKLSKFIPDFPRGDEVTIHHLLTHTSGIHSFTNRPSFLKYVTLSITPKSLVDSIKTWPYDFNPGDRYLYNNSGFFILGYIVENISGKSFAEYLNDTFFKPLGMNSTGIYSTTLLLNNEAYGYSIENGNIIKALNWDMSWAGGAGAIYSTVRDLYTWNEAIFNGKVLKDESLKAAFTPVILNNKEKSDYGYGWAFQDVRGYKFISHGGGLHGFQSFLERQPENKITVVVLCNSTPPPAGIDPASNAVSIAEYLLWKDMQKQSSFGSDLFIDESTLKSYVGRYDYGQGRVLIVTLDGKQLNAQMTGQPMFPIFPSSKNEFNWKVVEAKVRFETNENGIVTNLIHYQGGQQLVAQKLKDETPVTVNPSIFDKYTGKYDMGNSTVFEVSKEGDKLMVQGPNMPKYQLFPASETEYFAREVTIRLTFIINADGKVNAIDLNNSGIIIKANRIN
jgi:CubicO group peptidase (beta-lactamase class C family)